jgi:hypothetical protein
MLGTHLFGLPNVSQAGLEPMLVAAAAHLFSQCNEAWRSLPQARVQGIEVLTLLCASPLPSMTPASQ